jgi:hypothetical protein
MERKGIEGYDERQKALRHKFGYQAFWVLLILTFLNAYICEFIYVWGSPLAISTVIAYFSVFYFGLRTVFAGAYTGDEVSERRTAIMMPIVCGAVFVVFLIFLPAIIGGHVKLIEDGKVTIHIVHMISPVSISILAMTYYTERRRDKRDAD